jgi:hypothetical protein
MKIITILRLYTLQTNRIFFFNKASHLFEEMACFVIRLFDFVISLRCSAINEIHTAKIPLIVFSGKIYNLAILVTIFSERINDHLSA